MAAPSSPLSTPPSSDNAFRSATNAADARIYRPTRELPFELAQHVQTYYEETLFSQAFDFLTSVVSNSISASNQSTPVLLPGPAHFALAATVTVHPSLTTRTTVREKWNQSNAALRLLRLVLNTAGPINANFLEAFRFTKYENRSSRILSSTHASDDEENQSPTFKTRYATTDNLFICADDFWSVIGWTFNCSCLQDMYASRWSHWELLLTFMLDLLEADWQLHYAANTSEESLIWHFVELASGGYGRARRIIRAVFADGSTRSLNEFREIFHNEPKPPKDEDGKLKQRTTNVDIDKDEYGDYFAPDESDVSDDETIANLRPTKRARTRTPSRRTTPRTSNESLRSSYSAYDADDSSTTSTSTLGPPNALRLRLRLLHLLSHISGHPSLLSTSPTTFPDLDDLYTLFVEFIKPLPLPIFQQIVCPGSVVDVLSVDAASTLAEMLLHRLLESAAPAERTENFLTIKKLVECYLPYAAGGKGGAVEQARVSLLCEALLRRCAGAGMLDRLSEDADELGEGEGAAEDGERVTKQKLADAVEEGVLRREEKARESMEKRREGRKGKAAAAKDREKVDQEAWEWLKGSGARMRMVLKSIT